MQLLRVIEELETLIENSTGVMGKKLVDEESFYVATQKLRTAIPREIKEANDILNGARPMSPDLATAIEHLTDDDKLRLINQWSAEWLGVRNEGRRRA